MGHNWPDPPLDEERGRRRERTILLLVIGLLVGLVLGTAVRKGLL